MALCTEWGVVHNSSRKISWGVPRQRPQDRGITLEERWNGGCSNSSIYRAINMRCTASSCAWNIAKIFTMNTNRRQWLWNPLKFSLDSIATYDKGVAFHSCVLEKHSKLQITFERGTILLLAWSWVKLPFKKEQINGNASFWITWQTL